MARKGRITYGSRNTKKIVSEEITVRTLREKIVWELRDLKGINRRHLIMEFVGCRNGDLDFGRDYEKWYGSPDSVDGLVDYLIDLRRVYTGDELLRWKLVKKVKRVRRKK